MLNRKKALRWKKKHIELFKGFSYEKKSHQQKQTTILCYEYQSLSSYFSPLPNVCSKTFMITLLLEFN